MKNEKENITTAIPPVKPKRITGDSEAERYLEIQMSLKNESKISNWLISVLTMGFIFIFAILIFVLPDKTFSPEENRVLKTFPEFTRESFFSGEFGDEFGTYMEDQFPCRNFFVGLKAACETLQLKLQNNDTFIAENDMLIARNDYPSEKYLSENLKSISVFTKNAKNNNINVLNAFAGRKMDVLTESLPTAYGSYYGDRIWSILDKNTKDGGITYLNLRNSLKEAAKEDGKLYYNSDHHWTTHGAYLAYVEIARELGITPFAEDDFEIEKVTDEFFGTTWSAAGVKWADGDEINYYRYVGDENYTVKILDNRKSLDGKKGVTYVKEGNANYALISGFYVRDFLNEKDKYASFLGGNFGYTEITKNASEQREKLVIIKDSFAHSLAPFLARHYDLILLDMRYYNRSVIKLCAEQNITNVLILENMETLTEAHYLKYLRLK